jgi:hypothetical protein
VPAANVQQVQQLPYQADLLHTIALTLALTLVFIRFSLLHEILTIVVHINAHLLILFGIPAIFTVIVAGGLRRSMAARATYYWTGFAVWAAVCVPFSVWRAASATSVLGYFRVELLMLFVIAGFVLTWKECVTLTRVIAAATLVNILSTGLLSKTSGERIGLDWGGSVSNPNDLAAILVLGLPFLLLPIYRSRSLAVRILVAVIMAGGLISTVRTGSRGALLALAVQVILIFFRGSLRERVTMLCLVPIGFVTVLAVVPSNLLVRLRSFSFTSQGASLEALESRAAREYLLDKSIEYTLQFPLFGVGPNQFATYEGTHSDALGSHGLWHGTHNSITQASSECGIPGALLWLAGWASSFLLLRKTYRTAKARADCDDIRITAHCIQVAMAGFFVAIFFLNFAYFFYGPALAGLSISVWRAANYEFERRSAAPIALAAAAGA